MELNWLKYFYEVARVGSVTQAGLYLRVSQPAVTKTIRQLEAGLGYKLLVKSGRNIRLSSEGERLYQHCIPLFKKIEQIKGLGNELTPQWEGTIRLGASDNLCNYLLPSAIRNLSRHIPQADWSVYAGSSKEIKQKLISGDIDFGIFYTDLSLTEQRLLREEILGTTLFVAVCSSKMSKNLSLAQLRKRLVAYVGSRFSDYSHTLPEQWIVKSLNIPFTRTFQTNSKETQKQMVLQGMGFGIFPLFMVEKELRNKKLTLIRGAERQMTLRAVVRSDETLTEMARLLLNAIKKSL